MDPADTDDDDVRFSVSKFRTLGKRKRRFQNDDASSDSESAASESAASESAVSESAVSESAMSESAVSESAVSENAASESAASESAASESAASESAASESDDDDDEALCSGKAQSFPVNELLLAMPVNPADIIAQFRVHGVSVSPPKKAKSLAIANAAPSTATSTTTNTATSTATSTTTNAAPKAAPKAKAQTYTQNHEMSLACHSKMQIRPNKMPKLQRMYQPAANRYVATADTVHAMLQQNGIAVVEDVLGAAEVGQALDGFWGAMEEATGSFMGKFPPMQRAQPHTWGSASVLEGTTSRGVHDKAGLPHAKFMWDVRKKRPLGETLQKALAVGSDSRAVGSWEGVLFLHNCHQRKPVRAVHLHKQRKNAPVPPERLVHALLLLTDMDPRNSASMCFLDGSHKHNAEYESAFPTQLDAGKIYSNVQFNFFADKGCAFVALAAKRGSLVLWHPHLACGVAPCVDIASQSELDSEMRFAANTSPEKNTFVAVPITAMQTPTLGLKEMRERKKAFLRKMVTGATPLLYKTVRATAKSKHGQSLTQVSQYIASGDFDCAKAMI